MGTTEFPPIETPLIDGDVAFRQHSGGHTAGAELADVYHVRRPLHRKTGTDASHRKVEPEEPAQHRILYLAKAVGRVPDPPSMPPMACQRVLSNHSLPEGPGPQHKHNHNRSA